MRMRTFLVFRYSFVMVKCCRGPAFVDRQSTRPRFLLRRRPSPRQDVKVRVAGPGREEMFFPHGTEVMPRPRKRVKLTSPRGCGCPRSDPQARAFSLRCWHIRLRTQPEAVRLSARARFSISARSLVESPRMLMAGSGFLVGMVRSGLLAVVYYLLQGKAK